MSLTNELICYEISTNKQHWFEFNKEVLIFVVINDVFFYTITKRIDLSEYFLRNFEWPWDIERGIKILVFDDTKNKLMSFRYKINYIDFCSQFVNILIGGILLALILKKIKHKN